MSGCNHLERLHGKNHATTRHGSSSLITVRCSPNDTPPCSVCHQQHYPHCGGVTGPTGHIGYRGHTGCRGPTGHIGYRGHTGPSGQIGPSGQVGSIGHTGSAGDTGPTGSTGERGPMGLIGQVGSTGMTGHTGPMSFGMFHLVSDQTDVNIYRSDSVRKIDNDTQESSVYTLEQFQHVVLSCQAPENGTDTWVGLSHGNDFIHGIRFYSDCYDIYLYNNDTNLYKVYKNFLYGRNDMFSIIVNSEIITIIQNDQIVHTVKNEKSSLLYKACIKMKRINTDVKNISYSLVLPGTAGKYWTKR